MSWRSPFRLMALAMAKPCIGTSITPNHLTTIRLITGLGAAAAFAIGTPDWVNIGAGAFLFSLILDKSDGELARLTGQTSSWGHLYDTLSDAAVTILSFIGIGFGLDYALGEDHGDLMPWLGIAAGIGIGLTYYFVEKMDAIGRARGTASPNNTGFEPDDLLAVVSVAAWAGELGLLLKVSALCGVIGMVVTFGLYVRDLRQFARERGVLKDGKE